MKGTSCQPEASKALSTDLIQEIHSVVWKCLSLLQRRTRNSPRQDSSSLDVACIWTTVLQFGTSPRWELAKEQFLPSFPEASWLPLRMDEWGRPGCWLAPPALTGKEVIEEFIATDADDGLVRKLSWEFEVVDVTDAPPEQRLSSGLHFLRSEWWWWWWWWWWLCKSLIRFDLWPTTPLARVLFLASVCWKGVIGWRYLKF